MKRIILFSLLCVSFLKEAKASQIDKAYEALRIYDYFKAKQLFYDQLKKHPVEASYGLATIYYRNDNPFHQLDSSYKFINICKENFKLVVPDKRLELKIVYQIYDSTLVSLHDSICKKAYLQFIPAPGIESSEKYISTYHHSPYTKKVICLRDSFGYMTLKIKLTSELCQNYIYTYPQSCYLSEARNLFEFALYMENTSAQNDEGYLNYLKKFPQGKYIQLAKEELLNYYIRNKVASGIYTFIKNYGNTYPTAYAWNMLLGIEVPNYSKAELETFLAKYPEYPLKNEIEEEFKYWQTPFFNIKKNDKFGYCDSTGKIIIEPTYSEEEDFNEGYALVQKYEQYGFINKTGKTKIGFQYDEATSFTNHVAIVQKNKLSFLIDYSNKQLSNMYDEIADLTEGLAIVKKNNLYGAINQNGDEILKPSFENLSDFSEGIAAYLKNGKYGFIDKQGFTFIAPLYNWVASFKNGLCRVQFNKYYGLINKKGDFVAEPSFDLIDEAARGIYLVVKNNLYGFIDSTGCYLSEIKYNYNPSLKPAELANEKYVKLITPKKQVLQNINGAKYFQEENFEEVSLPVNNFVIVKEKNKFNLYSLGKSLPVKRSFLDIYSDGKFWYLKNKKGTSVYDLNLNQVLFTSPEDKIASFNIKYFLVESEEGKGLLDKNGNEILSPQYDEIKTTSVSHILYVERNEKGAYFNTSARTFVWKEEGFDSL